MNDRPKTINSGIQTNKTLQFVGPTRSPGSIGARQFHPLCSSILLSRWPDLGPGDSNPYVFGQNKHPMAHKSFSLVYLWHNNLDFRVVDVCCDG